MRKFLQGKKTYILLIFATLSVVIDYLGGVGLTPFCVEQLKTKTECTMTLQEFVTQIGGLGVVATIRAAISGVKKEEGGFAALAIIAIIGMAGFGGMYIQAEHNVVNDHSAERAPKVTPEYPTSR